MLSRDGSCHARPAGLSTTSEVRLRGDLDVLETLALLVSAAWSWAKARAGSRLEPWQEHLVHRATESFLRGLMHSDGCRVIANDRGVESVRYHFSNRSEDIKRLFCAALDSLGIPWTRPSDRDIAIYRKEAVARLDRFIGPKQ